MATIKQTLSSLRSRAEIYYNANGFSYKGLCASADFNELVAYVVKEDDQVALTKEEKKASTYQCNDTATAWAFAVPLPNLAGKVGCVDSTGYVGDQDGGLSSGSDYACAN